MKKLLVLFPILFLIASFCSNEQPLPGGYEAMPRSSKGEMLTFSAPLIRSGQFRAPVLAGSAPYLLLGDFDGVKARVALLFTSLSSIDTARVQQAKLIMRPVAFYGNCAPLQGTIHPITTNWSETSVVWKDIESNYDMGQTFHFSFSAGDSQLSSLIDGELVNRWIRKENNYGLLLTFQQADGMVKLNSSENISDWAKLEVIYIPKAGGLDTVTVGVDQDASLFEYDNTVTEYQLQENPQQLVIHNGTGDRFLLQFDISSLPVEATIHRALLSFSVDLPNSRTDSGGVLINVKQVVTDSAWVDLRYMKMDSVFSTPSAVASQEAGFLYFSQTPDVGYMGSMVQRWVLKLQGNYGILVQSAQYGQDMEKVVFYGATAEASLRPRLYITYSLPPAPRF